MAINTNVEDVGSPGCLRLDGQELQVAVGNSNPMEGGLDFQNNKN